jgi:hypothetical protein
MELIADREEIERLLALNREGEISAEQLARLDELLERRGRAIDEAIENTYRRTA